MIKHVRNTKNKILRNLLVISAFLLLIPFRVDGAILYLEPSEGEYQPEDTFITKVKIDIGEECINTVKADLKFSQEVLEAVDFSQGDSILTLWLEFPEINQSEGLISFTGGIPAGYCGEIPEGAEDSNLLGRIIFKVQDIEIDQVEVKFLNTSQVLLNDGLGTIDELNTKGAVYAILQNGLPVKNEWQQELEQDKVPPEVFEVEIHQDSAIFEGKYFIIFSTIDKQTGLDLYEVKEGKRDWQRAESPYLLEDQTLQSIIKVKAVDKAGNERIAGYIPSKPFPYWIVILIIILIIIGAGIICFIIRSRITRITSRGAQICVILLVICASLLLTKPVRAGSASLYLSPASGTFYLGSTFDVSIFLNTGGNDVNAVEVDLKFDPKKLQIASPTAGKSFISVWVSQPIYSNVKGTASFKGGIPSPGINTSSGLVSTITFRAMAPGEASVSFLDSSQVLLDDGKGTDVLSSLGGGVYTIVIPPPEGPKVFSSTHPDQNKWYKDNNPTFSWEKEEGVTDFSYSMDHDFRGVSDNIPEGDHTSVSYSNLGDGIWYFHVKAKKGNVWGGTSHYLAQIDITQPADFTLSFEPVLRSPTITSHEPVVSFISTDALSGLDHYELKIINLNKTAKEKEEQEFFVEVVSPYKLPRFESGEYQIVVRAYDLAGNWRDVSEKIEVTEPGKMIYIIKKGIHIFGIFLSWWKVVLVLLFLVISILGFILLWCRRRKNVYQRREALKRIKEKAKKNEEDIKKRLHEQHEK